MPGDEAVSPRAPERASKSSNTNHDLSFSDSGPELGSLSLAIVLGVEHDSSNLLGVDHVSLSDEVARPCY